VIFRAFFLFLFPFRTCTLRLSENFSGLALNAADLTQAESALRAWHFPIYMLVR
jgi:hypothetical protein